MKKAHGQPDFASDTKKARIQLDFAPDALNRLERLQHKLEAASRAEVIRRALGLLEWVINHEEEGERLLLERKDGMIVPVLLLPK
jgi:hypothetical protein